VAVGLGLALGIDLGGDRIAYVPEFLVEEMFLPLLEDLHGHAAGADHAVADDPLRQFEMVVTEELHALVEVDQLFGDVMQREKFRMLSIHFFQSDAGLLQLREESVAQAWRDVQQRKEAGGIQSAAVAK